MRMFSIYVKTLSDSTLMQMKKKDLVEYVRMCERNLANAYATLDQQATNFKKLLDEKSERPKGRWIEEWRSELDTYSGEYWEERYYKCSLCGRFECVKENFCPNCGTDMRGEHNE